MNKSTTSTKTSCRHNSTRTGGRQTNSSVRSAGSRRQKNDCPSALSGPGDTQEVSPKSTRSPPLTPEARKERARWQRIERVYGITKEQYDDLNTGVCPICLRGFDDNVRPVVDHDHSTGEVRGILCFYCNHRVVGRHRDGSLIRRVADYLDAPRRGWIVPPKKKKRKKKTK